MANGGNDMTGAAPEPLRVSPISINIGERSRGDLGDIDELAESIAAIGLLHPIVVTADLQLVAGGRRLSAVRKLGWLEVPVTVVDLTDAAETLRAEADENSCRKALTPLEAAVMRERRAALLAGEAAKRADEGRKRGAAIRRGDLPAKLAERSDPPTSAAETRKVAAIGTGYSGSTLDKVDDLREWASDDGTFGSAPIPPEAKPAVEQALRAVNQPAAAVSREHRKAREAIAAAMAEDPGREAADYRAAEFRRNLTNAIRAAQMVTQFDAQRTADVIEDVHMRMLDELTESVTDWVGEIRRIRTGLRVVNGGKA